MAQDKKKKSNPLYINKHVNKWAVTNSVNEDGKVSLVAWKTVGTIDKAATAGDNETSINLNHLIKNTDSKYSEL